MLASPMKGGCGLVRRVAAAGLLQGALCQMALRAPSLGCTQTAPLCLTLLSVHCCRTGMSDTVLGQLEVAVPQSLSDENQAAKRNRKGGST